MTRFKIGITVLSAALTALGGVAYAQSITYVNPETQSRMAETIYGLIFVLFTVFLPAGIWGGLVRALARQAAPPARPVRSTGSAA